MRAAHPQRQGPHRRLPRRRRRARGAARAHAGPRRRGRRLRRRRRLALPAPAASRGGRLAADLRRLRLPARARARPPGAAARRRAAPRSRRRCARGRALRVARRLADDGLSAFAEARRRGLEGVIGKDPSVALRCRACGRRAWCKVKVRAEEEFVIGGFTAPRGGRRHLGALLVGALGRRRAALRGQGRHRLHRGDARRSASAPARRSARARLTVRRSRRASATSPGSSRALVAQLGFTERTGDGKLRHPDLPRPARRQGRRGGPAGRARRGLRALHRVAVAHALEDLPARLGGRQRRRARRRRSRRRAPGP